jgi:hypothetical protein
MGGLTPEEFAKKAGISVKEAEQRMAALRTRTTGPDKGSAFRTPTASPPNDLPPTRMSVSHAGDKPAGSTPSIFKEGFGSAASCSELKEKQTNGGGLNSKESHRFNEQCTISTGPQ